MRTTSKRILAVAAGGALVALFGTGWMHANVGATGQDARSKAQYDCSSGACTKRTETEPGGTEAATACAYGTQRCEQYSACSLHGDLSGATGETLEMYFRERREDGRVYDDFELPEFSALTLAGKPTSSGELLGRPALLAFVAAHCRHSMRAMPHLQEIADTYGPEGLRVITVWVNSGGAEDVRETTKSFSPTYETWVHTSPSVGDAVGSHLVPSFFFIGEDGQVREKWVGEKTRDALVVRAAALLD